MKKMFLAAILAVISFAANAANRIDINNTMPGCAGANITVQFVQYEIGPCTNHGYSPVYPATTGLMYDLDDPMTWAPTPLLSYQTYSAIVCITCPGGLTICLPPVGIGPTPTCDPSVQPAVNTCCGPMAADVTTSGGRVCFHLNIHP